MNIRSVSNPAELLGKEKIEASNNIKSAETDDREANGQQPHADGAPYRSLSEEEMESVLEKIRGHEGIKKQALQVNHRRENDQNIVTIETAEGQIIKRFVERDLYFLLYGDNPGEVSLLNKTA